MKPTMRVVVLGVALAAYTAAFGQTATRPPRYDVKAEISMTGKVTNLQTIPDWMGRDGVNIALQLENSTAPHIDVATAGFLQSLEFPIAVGDQLDLKGYWSESADGSRVFLVHELTNKKVTLMVRDPSGQPLW
jgi:hypothetical protein